MKVLVASSEKFAGCMIESLLRAGHEVVGVLSPAKGIYDRQQFTLRFRMLKMRGWDALSQCRRRAIPFRIIGNLEDGSIVTFIKQQKPDLLVVFGWPSLITEQSLRHFPRGGMNIHPSLLPLLRGPDPLFHIIDKASNGYGLSFHKLVPELDAGPIYLQVPMHHGGGDSYDRLYVRILEGIHRHLGEAIGRLIECPEGAPQRGDTTTAKRFKPAFRVLDPNAEPEAIMRRTRACYSHHTRLTAVGETPLHFNWCESMPLMDRQFDMAASIQKVGLYFIDVNLSGRYMRLRGVRVHDQPWWLSPYHLRRCCRPGMRLAALDDAVRLAKENDLL